MGGGLICETESLLIVSQVRAAAELPLVLRWHWAVRLI